MMRKNIIYGIVLLGFTASMGLTSCQVLNPYKAPQTDTTGLFRDVDRKDSTSIAAISWRDYFTDSNLQALIDEGLQNNFDMKIALQRVIEAEVALSIARASYFPTAALSANAQHQRSGKEDKTTGNVTALGDHKNAFSLMLGVSWEIDVWGKLNRQSRANYAQYLNSREGRNLVQTNLVAAIATSYYTLLSLDEKLKISLESIQLLEETVSTMEEMKKQGFLNGASVEQTKATLYNTQVSIPDLKMSIHSLENALSLLVGRSGYLIERSDFARQSVPENLQVGFPAQILANRPDVRSAELSFRAAFELTNVAQAGLYPTITLGSSTSPMAIGYQSGSLSDFFKPLNLVANLVGGITQPIFAKNQLTGNLKIKKAQQEEALLNYEKTVITASNEVSNIVYTLNTSLQKNDFRRKQIESLQKSVEYTQLLLKANEANYLEVITSEANLLQAQLGQVNDKLQQLQASVDLYHALGGGVE